MSIFLSSSPRDHSREIHLNEGRLMSQVRILVVDDLEWWRTLVSSILQEDPAFQIVGEAADGLKAIHTAEKLQPGIILMDVDLPGLNGIKAGGWLRRLVPNAKLIYVSQEFDLASARAVLQLGARGCVLKSDAARELVWAIHSVVRGEVFISQGLSGFELLPGKPASGDPKA